MAEGGIARYVQGRRTRIAGPPCGRVGRTPSKSPDLGIKARCRDFRSETGHRAYEKAQGRSPLEIGRIAREQRTIAVNQGESMSRRHRRQFDGEHRNVKGSNAEVSIGDTACGISRGPGNSIGIVSRFPQRARRAMGLLASGRDSRCGSVTSRGTHERRCKP
jgi:hypothetical protein